MVVSSAGKLGVISGWARRGDEIRKLRLKASPHLQHVGRPPLTEPEDCTNDGRASRQPHSQPIACSDCTIYGLSLCPSFSPGRPISPMRLPRTEVNRDFKASKNDSDRLASYQNVTRA
jgi:hypothetical protein